MSDPTRSICLECGAWGPVNEYHPFAYCMLVKAIGQESARANIDDVVAYGRKLERAHLEAEGMAVVPKDEARRAWRVGMLNAARICRQFDRAKHAAPEIEALAASDDIADHNLSAASPYGKASMQEAED